MGEVPGVRNLPYIDVLLVDLGHRHLTRKLIEPYLFDQKDLGQASRTRSK